MMLFLPHNKKIKKMMETNSISKKKNKEKTSIFKVGMKVKQF